MRGIPSLITDIRKKVFTEVARMAYSGDYTQMEDIPFRIVPGSSPLHRESVFLERAIAGERVRLAMGLSLQPVQQRQLFFKECVFLRMPRRGLFRASAVKPHAPLFRNGAVSGLPCGVVPAGVPQGRDQICKRPQPHHREPLHQVRQMRGSLPVSRHRAPRAPLSGGVRDGRHRRGRIRQGADQL